MTEKQTTLPLVSDATQPDAPETAIAVVADELIEPRHGALVDLRQYAMSLPVDRMLAGMDEYKARRKAFRRELLSMLIQGVHYGFPPGTEPKLDDDGNAWVWSGKKQKEVLVKKEQWQHKASFYKAGADFVCDVLGVRDEYKADLEAWQQAGSKPGNFVFACYLMSRSTGELLGEGRGARRVEKDDENKAIKMAKKSAKVDAVLNTYGLADLFTQDMEDGTQPPHDNPTPREDAPKVKPRGDRGADETVKAEVSRLLEAWKTHRPLKEQSREKWAEWVRAQTGGTFDVFKPNQWTADAMMKVRRALDAEDGYVE